MFNLRLTEDALQGCRESRTTSVLSLSGRQFHDLDNNRKFCSQKKFPYG